MEMLNDALRGRRSAAAGDRDGRRSAVQLIEHALSRSLVIAPAPQLGAVADAPGGDVVEVDLEDELGTQGDPLQILACAPRAGVGRAALAGLIRGEEADQPLLLGGAEPGAVPDDP